MFEITLCGSVACRFHVLVEITFERESLVALLTDVRFNGGVRLDVCAEVGLVGEGLAALGAGEGALPCVSTDVPLE